MSVERIISIGVSLTGTAIVGTVAQNTRSVAPQIFLVAAVVGFIFSVISSACLNSGPAPKLGHLIYPAGIGFSAITSFDLFSRLHGSPIGHWEFIQNRVVSEVGMLTGITAGLLLGHVVLNCQNLSTRNA